MKIETDNSNNYWFVFPYLCLGYGTREKRLFLSAGWLKWSIVIMREAREEAKTDNNTSE